MLQPRLIPCLLIHKNGLVKTIKFENPKYVGDPINAVRIFNEKVVDELLVIDIDATTHGRSPNFKMIANLARECRMPLTYGGGVTTLEQIQNLIGLGVEKVSMSAAAISNPDLIKKATAHVGSQSVVVTIDIKKTGFLRRYEIVTHNGTKRTGIDPIKFATRVQDLGAGEIVVNSVDMDGTLQGYDVDLITKFQDQINVPLTVLGGAGSLDDISELWKTKGLIGAAAGSLFVFKGKYRAVLINYPNLSEKNDILLSAGWKS
ncbi:AglZ/HisF2 family acetamidino modification protein [Planktomarina temperata]|nr:AglZ/HisF2 family acetamidino modification protein [Planktomarina temperata]